MRLSIDECKAGLVSGAAAALVLAAAASAVAADSFPNASQVEYLRTEITMPMYAGGDRNNAVEELKLKALLRIERGGAQQDSRGTRVVPFTITNWDVYGYSEYLGAHVSFVLSDVAQPKSLVMANTDAADFPASIVYNSIYDIYIDGKRISTHNAGVAYARNIATLPPSSISFPKPFVFQYDHARNKVAAGDVLTGTEEIVFDEGFCYHDDFLSVQEWQEGVALGRAIRRGTINLKELDL